MHVDQPLRSRALMQIVDILGDEQQLAGPFRVELRWRDPGGNVQEHTLSLPPGWHTVLLGWPVPKER